MYYELNWLGAVLLVLGLLAFAGPAVRWVLRVRRDRAVVRDRRGSRRRRLGLGHKRL